MRPARSLSSKPVPLAALALLASCASYRYLPLPSTDAAPESLTTEMTRAFFFSSPGIDAIPERLFTSPDGATLIATVLRPSSGVLASSDGGASWSFSSFPIDEKVAPRVFREVLFDASDKARIYARTFNGLMLSKDGGKSWDRVSIGNSRRREIDALALGPDGTLYVAQADALYASGDHGESFQPLPLVLQTVDTPIIAKGAEKGAEDVRPDPVRIRSVLPDPALPKTLYVSVEPEPPVENFQRRLIGLLDQTTPEGIAARALFKLPTDKPLEHVAYGDSRAGVYVTHDGGRLWQKTGLGLDSWLTARGGAVYAVAAEPLVIATGLILRTPGLAAAIDAQLHENGFDPETLRRGCGTPDRATLLAGSPTSPIFRTNDGGNTWSRLEALDAPLALALRLSMEQQRAGRSPWAPRPIKRAPEVHDMDTGLGPDQPNGGRKHNRARTAQEMAEPIPPPDLTEPLLQLLEPAGILAHLGPDLPLTGVASAGEHVLWAYAPTPEYWAQLTDALVRATRRQGELSLGTGSEVPKSGNGFELLRSEDSGRTWTAFPATLDRFGVLSARGITPYPDSIAATNAQALFLLSGHDKDGHGWRQLLREDANGNATATAPSRPE